MHYQHPKEDSNLKGVLEEDDVNEHENKAGPVEPEVIVRGTNDQISFDRNVFLGNLSC